jgi:PAS domain-containing protein
LAGLQPGRQPSFLAALLTHLSDALVACNTAGRLTVFNPAAMRLHGLPAEPIPAEQWASHYALYLADGRTPMTRDEVPLYRALRGELVQDVEMVVHPTGRSPRRLQASGQQILGPGRPAGHHGAGRRRDRRRAGRLQPHARRGLVAGGHHRRPVRTVRALAGLRR